MCDAVAATWGMPPLTGIECSQYPVSANSKPDFCAARTLQLQERKGNLWRVKPEAKVDLSTGEITLSLKGAESNPELIVPEVFALPGELSKNAGFRMAICLDEFQPISQFDRNSVDVYAHASTSPTECWLVMAADTNTSRLRLVAIFLVESNSCPRK